MLRDGVHGLALDLIEDDGMDLYGRAVIVHHVDQVVVDIALLN